MGLFTDIKDAADRKKLGFMVIGGVAVIFHGFSRDTADLDLLVRRDDRQSWLDLLGTLGYSAASNTDNFAQLSPPIAGAWPVDFMFVNDATFLTMFGSAIEAEMHGAKLKIPTLEHLIALKLHALKHGHIGRIFKDLLDVEGLVRLHSIDLKSEKWRNIFLKYGTLKLYEQISRFTSIQEP